MATLSSRLAPQLILAQWRDSAWGGFFGDYVKWPLLLLAGSGIFLAGIHYAGAPLVNDLAGKIEYLAANWQLSRGEDEAALSSIRAALTHSRADAATWKLAAVISAREDPDAAAYCWQQADSLEPNSPATQMSLAEAALKSREFDLAAAALAEVNEPEQSSERFLLLAAKLAEARGNAASARRSYDGLAKLRSVSLPTLLALASYRARSGNPTEVRKGMGELCALVRSSDLRGEAERELIDASCRMGDRTQALSWSDRLLGSNKARWSDRLHRLDLLSGNGREAWLAFLLTEAWRPAQVVGLADWLLAHNAAERALIWIREQPEEMQNDVTVAEARAKCLVALGLWRHLRDVQQAERWRSHDSARLMYLSIALLRLGDENGARGSWARAVFSCQTYGDFQALRKTSEQTEAEKPASSFWPEAQTLVLDHMAAAYPGAEELVRALLRSAQAERDSVGVEACWQRLSDLHPGDLKAAAHWNQLSLLRGVRIGQATEAIALLRRDHPENADVLTASAYSLYRQGHFLEAAEALGEISVNEMEAPERALVIGSVLAVTGSAESARGYLQAALKQPELLPEEQTLARASQTLIEYRTRIACLLRPLSQAGLASSRADAELSSSSPLAVVAQSVELSLRGETDHAVALLAGIEVRKLGPPEWLPYLGSLFLLAGDYAKARSYLRLDSELPEETASQFDHRALEIWWGLLDKTSNQSAARQGLFAIYLQLEETETNAGFWKRDAPRELTLIRAALLRGEDVAAVSQRLTLLLRHFSFGVETQEDSALAAFRRGQFQAARRCLEELTPQDLQRPETALYYGVALKACGEKEKARRYLELARQAKLSPPDQAFAWETSAFS